MKKKFVRLISAVLSAAMTLTAVPLSAFAEGEAHTHDGESNVITTPLDFREKTADESGDGWSWDHDTKTLTLDGVNIQATTEENMMSVVTVPDGTKIVLNGENTIVQTNTGDSDTYVLSAVNNKEVNCDGTMTISGDGVLNAENRSTDSMARSLGGSIILNGGTVNATGTVKTNSLEIHNDGVLNANATTASFEGVAVNVSGGITVDGNGSLTAVGCANESTLNSAILLNSNFGDKISVSGNGSITVPESNAARVGIYYSGNNSGGMNAEISDGKVTAYGTKYGIYNVNLIMSGTGSVYTTGGSYAIGQTVPTIDEDEFVVKGSTESKASESAVTGEVKLNGGYYEIDGADAKTLVIKPDTSPRIILGKQTGIFKTEEYEIIEDMDMTDIKLKGTVYFDITLKNMSDEEFADARGCFGGDEPDLSANIIKTDYGWVCMVCDTKFSVTYDTDNTLTIKCGDIVSNTVQVKSNANRFNKVTQGDNTNRTVFYTNTSQEEKDNYKLVSTYTVDSESISYNWYSTNSAYSADELGAAVSGSNGEFKLADNIPAGNYVLYCDITYSDGDSTETVTEKFTFTYKECAHENGYSDGKCTNCGALCDHSNIDIDTGKCNECAHQFVATISTDGSAPTGYDTLADCLNSITADTGNYVKIYQDIGDTSATATLDTIDVKHNVMIDLNGHKLNNIKLGVNKDVTLTLTGTAGSYVTQVYVRKGGGSFIIDSEANVEFNTIFVEDSARLAVNDGAKVTTEQLTVIASVADDGTTTTSVKLATGMKIGGLTYHRQNNSGALKLGNLLDVTRQALRREDNGNYLDLYKEYGSMGYSVALTVVEHTDADHKYSDGTGKCEECGKPCEHGGDINTDTGICSICGAVVSVALYTDKNGSLKYVDTDELDSILNEYNGSGTIKLFKDYSKPSAQYDLYGELTIDLNGRRLNIRSITPCKNGKLTIKNSGNPVMLGCNVYPTNDASYAGGTLIIDGDVVLDTSIYVYDSSTVILKAGAYPAGLYARDSKTLYDMLGEGKAFFKTDGTLFNASVKEISSSETLTVKDHSHTYVDGKCGCGYACPHSDVDINTGKCTECEYQYAAVIVKDGAVASVYKETEMGAAFEAADSDANTGCTLRVYKNYTGSYTTLSGEFTLLLAGGVNAGDLTVTGNITVSGFEDSDLEKAEFTVNGGTLVFDENCSVSGTVTVGEGSRFESNSNDIQIALDIINEDSEISLAGGYFGRITYTGGGNRANDSISTLLAPKKAFWDVLKSSVIDGSKYKLSDGISTVTINPHENHAFDSATGKCACGAYCDHSNANTDTGVCNDCGHEFALGVLSDSGNKFYDDADTVFEDLPDGTTVKLYKNCSVSLDSIDVGVKEITVDLNGFTLSGDGLYFETYEGTTLNVIDSKSGGVFNADILVWNNSVLNIGTEDGENNFTVKYIDVTTENGGKLNMYGGVCDTLDIDDYKENIAANINIYGGTIKSIRCGSSTATLNMLLAGGYAFEDENGEIIDAYAVDFSTERENINVTAVKHTHSYSHETGKCACGAYPLAMFTESRTGNISFVTTISELQELMTDEYRDGVIMLTEDISNNLTIKGVKTIDFNGHKFSGTIVSNGNITFANSSSNRAEIAKSVYILNKLTVNGDILFGDNFRATSSSADIVLNSGTYTTIVAPSGKTVLDLLPKGKALTKVDADGITVGLYDAGVSTAHEEDFMLKIVAHPEHDFDEHGHCGCGYQCAHSTIDTESNICKECNAIMRASVTAGSGSTETVKYFTRFTDAFDFAAKDANKGCTVKMLRSYANSDNFELSAGKFTIDLNGFNLIHNTLTVNDGAELTITSDGDSYNYSFDTITVNGGSLAMIGNEAHTTYPNIEVNGGSFSMDAENVTVSALRVKNNASVAIVSGKFKNLSGLLTNIISKGSCVYDLDSKAERSYENLAGVIATNNVGIKRCEHSDVSDSGLCAYCNTQFYEKLSYTADGVEKTEYFESLTEAINKANSVQTATMTILKDTSENYNDNIPDTTGDLTLVLNANTYTIWHIKNGAKLAVSGSGVLYCIIAANGSRVTAAGGVRLGDVTINGEGEIGECSIDILATGGKIADLLADGYAFKDKYGNWLTLEDRAKSNVQEVTVEKAPIASATVTANKTVLYRNGGGARQILFNFNVNTSDEYTISNDNKITVGLYVGDTLINESDFGGNSYTFANANEISDTDGTVKAHLVIKLNGYEYVTNDVEFEMATCTHPYEAFYSDSYGHHCSQCEASIYAVLAKANGDKVCYDNLVNAFNAAQLEENDGCALEVYSSMNRDCEVSKGSFTVKFKEEISYSSAVIKVSGGNVRFTGDDGCTVSKYPLSSVGYLIAVTGGTVTFDNITINDDSISVSGGKAVINSGTYNKLSVSGGTVALNGGTFSNINVSADGKKLTDLLGEKKAFATEDGALFNAYVTESSVKLTVTDHESHDFDEYGYCECGYQCPHDDLDTESNVCRECNAKMYAAVIVKSKPETDEDGDAITNAEESDEAEAKVYYFTKITEAFEFAVKSENEGCTLTMLRDFSDDSVDIDVNGGDLTVDMNGFGIYINNFNGSRTAITIRSDSECTFAVDDDFNMDGGTVTFSGEVIVDCWNMKLSSANLFSDVETMRIGNLILDHGILVGQSVKIANAIISNINTGIYTNVRIHLNEILASGSRIGSVTYSNLRGIDYYSSNFDGVYITRCDHPDGVDGDNRCIYCNALMAASVSYTEDGAEKTEYFVAKDLEKAFDKANSVSSATVTMLSPSAYTVDQLLVDLTVTGDVTLIANDYNALYNTVKVADGGKLTVRGNVKGYFAGVVAEAGSKVTVEEAIRIVDLTVNGGEVKLSGGQYSSITVNGGKITDILADGYAYKKTEGGEWLTLEEREVSEVSGVTVTKAPIKSATLSTEINKLYRNSNANPTLKFNLSLAHGSNLNDSYVSKRYGINSYVSGDIIYSSLSALVKDAKLSADEIIDKAGDSDVAEIYYVVTTGDGYEIKSNTVSIDLVDCDHSQVVDPTADKETAGNITTPTYCEICESKFNAKITKGDDVKYYNDLDEAAKDAQKSENEGCTLYPLYNKNGYGGQLVITEGNFTLKYAVRTAFSRPIIINGKAKLTVTGRCAVTAFENQDAFIVRGGDVTFDGLATGSNVTINGGNVTMAANNINCLTIHGGNVSISSGGFAEIVTTVSDKVIADYIDHGFWVQDRGTKEWIDIYSLNKATASSTNVLSVRLCPMQIIKPIDTVYYTNGYYPDGIPSLQINAEPWYSGEVDAKVAYQWIAIDENGYETAIEGATDRKLSLENLTTGRYYCSLTYSNATTAGVSMASDVVTATITECEHSGGKATCTEKAKCEICGAEYGEPLGHEYIETVVAPTYTSKGYTVFECTRCKHKYNGNFVPVKPIPDVEEIAVEKTTYDEVDISWKNISGVDGYYVEGYVGDQWKQINCSADGDRVAAKLSGLSAGLKYKVRIAAYAGSFTGKFRYFYVDTVPSPVWNINTVKATDETVRISWNRNTRADGYKVEWYIDNQWSVKTVTGNNNIAAVIDGLCAGTRYKVRVSAYKGDLYSPYTYGYIDTLPSKVTGITQTVTSSSFTLKWDKNESADGYTVQYYADGKWNEKTLTGNNKTAVTIGSLKGYKTYKVRIKAYKGELQSAFDDIYITTAPTKVSGLKVKSAVDSKAVVIWNADATADGYNVGYYIGGKWVEKTITDNKTAMAELDGLTPYSTYKVRVRAYKGNLYGDYSYTTVTAVLSPVTGITVVSAKSNSITVKWGKNASADGYKAEIYTGGKWVKKTLKGSTNATVTIDGLKAGSVYKVRIASYKGTNTSAYTYANVNTAK